MRTYTHLVQFTAKDNLTTEEILKGAIEILEKRLDIEYGCPTIRKAIEKIDNAPLARD